MKAIGYTRVFTEEQAREGISLENQRMKIEVYWHFNAHKPLRCLGFMVIYLCALHDSARWGLHCL
jgi:hypothetical protein